MPTATVSGAESKDNAASVRDTSASPDDIGWKILTRLRANFDMPFVMTLGDSQSSDAVVGRVSRRGGVLAALSIRFPKQAMAASSMDGRK